MPTETEARKVISSAGKSEPGGRRIGTGMGSGLTDTPTAAVRVMDALASPPRTSTDACPLRMKMTVIVGGLISSLTAMVMEADPDAISRLIARPSPMPPCTIRSGFPPFTPTLMSPFPARGETIQLNGLSGPPTPTRKSAESGDSVIARPRSMPMSVSSPRPSGRVGRVKLSVTVSLPFERAMFRPAPTPPGRNCASFYSLLKIDLRLSSAEP